MDTDQALEADTRVARVVTATSSDASRPPSYESRTKNNNASPSSVAKVSQEMLHDENTPLLARLSDGGNGHSPSESEEADDRPPPTWSGERDFEGVPWWKTPSVGTEHSDEVDKRLTLLKSRSSGLFLPS